MNRTVFIKFLSYFSLSVLSQELEWSDANSVAFCKIRLEISG